MSDWVQLTTFSNGFEADIAQQSLNEAEIPCLLQGNQAGMFGAGFKGPVMGGIALYVPSSALQTARELLELDE
ncbi:MAG: putative signal transducing protein [Gemmatimonadaceae bacterium]